MCCSRGFAKALDCCWCPAGLTHPSTARFVKVFLEREECCESRGARDSQNRNRTLIAVAAKQKYEFHEVNLEYK